MLDGHIILARPIAERGRVPAIDVLRSVSRCLPQAATPEENELLREYRRMIALYEEVAPMLRANLYEFGRDLNSDRAISLFPALDNFVATRKAEGIEGSFKELQEILETKPAASPAPPVTVTMVKR
jgi:flagellum-specific ATP synthase